MTVTLTHPAAPHQSNTEQILNRILSTDHDTRELCVGARHLQQYYVLITRDNCSQQCRITRVVNGGGDGGMHPPIILARGIQCLSSPLAAVAVLRMHRGPSGYIACRGHRSFQTFCIARSPTGFAYLVSSRSVAGLVRGPPLWPDRRDFCNYFGIIFSAVWRQNCCHQ